MYTLRIIFVPRLWMLCLILAAPGCARISGPEGNSFENVEFAMGGVPIQMTGPAGYQAAPWLQPWAAQWLMPPENIFALFALEDQFSFMGFRSFTGLTSGLRGHRLALVSARPEFMDEDVAQIFFQALCKDFIRMYGTWGPESLENFRRLTETYYQGLDAFSHSLGVFHHTNHSLSIARIVREGGSAGEGAHSSYAASGKDPADSRQFLPQEWALEYFASAYHKILIQNVLLLNGRCLNIYFSAPLADEADIHALMEENLRYVSLIVESEEKKL